MPWIVFVVVMGDLTLNHIFRTLASSGYEVVDITGTQMVLTMKLTTFAWNVYDGRRQPSVSTTRNYLVPMPIYPIYL